MDKETEKRLDSIVEDEVQKGYRMKKLPENLRAMLLAQGGPDIEQVRFTRLNPARRRKIAEVVQRQYHRDIQNADILSHEQIMQLVMKRGEWSPDKTKELEDLRTSVQRRMGVLYFGAENDDVIGDFTTKQLDLRSKVAAEVPADNQALLLQIFDRWVEYSPDRRAEYTETYAKPEGKEQYSPDSDFQKMVLLGGKFALRGLLEEIEALRDKIHDLYMLRKDRVKLMELQEKFARIFSDSAEQRREVTEQMARVFYTCERFDNDGKLQGPLVNKLDDLYDMPEEVIEWFQYESYFFHSGIPDEAREYLVAIGFLPAEQASTDKASQSSESEVSAESPVPPSSKTDSAPVEATPAPSTESVTVTN